MKELIKIETQGERRLVSARELHAFLESKRQFADWIKERINQYEFIENQDFTIHKFVNGKATQIEYSVTIDMAKELAMVERNEKGKQARQYFIEMEKVAVGQAKPDVSAITRKDLALMLLASEEELEKKTLALSVAEKSIQKLAPKAELMDKVLATDGLVDIGQSAKLLKLPYGRNTLFTKLRERGVFFKNRNEPKQEFVERGYFQLKENFIERSAGRMVVITPYVTQKGLEFIHRVVTQSKLPV